MVFCFNTRSVKTADQSIVDKIEAAGIPFDWYRHGMVPLGPVNGASVAKFANINTIISLQKLPLPPSRFIEMVADRCLNKSKLDYREIIDGPPGAGKSYSGMYGCCRYAIEAADRNGQDPKDYFSIHNCALLQDTAGVTQLMDEVDKYQAVFIDDAGVAAGHKDFATQSNKNLDAIMAVCRPKRWYVVFTAPMNKHLDLTIRELVYCKGNIFKSFHEANFNLLKQKATSSKQIGSKIKEYNIHYSFDDVKTDLYAYFNPEILDPYPHIVSQYDKARDEATDSLIHSKASQEKERKNPENVMGVREKKFAKLYEKYHDKVYKLTHDTRGNWLQPNPPGKTDPTKYSIRTIRSETGLSEGAVMKIIAQIKEGGK